MHAITAFISWTCYGQWLHGAARGSVDPEHNIVDMPWLPPDLDSPWPALLETVDSWLKRSTPPR
jgi:hypothetical protein